MISIAEDFFLVRLHLLQQQRYFSFYTFLARVPYTFVSTLDLTNVLSIPLLGSYTRTEDHIARFVDSFSHMCVNATAKPEYKK